MEQDSKVAENIAELTACEKAESIVLSQNAADGAISRLCRVVWSGRRVGVSEITVTNQDGKLIAKATGTTIPVNRS